MKNLKNCASGERRKVIEILGYFNLPPPLKYINWHLIKHDRRKSSRNKTEYWQNRILYIMEYLWLTLYIMKYLIVKTKTDVNRKFHIILQRIPCNKTDIALVRTTTWVVVCNNLYWLLKLHISQANKIFVHSHQSSWLYNCQKLLETIKNYCLEVIDSDIEECPWALKCKRNNKIF